MCVLIFSATLICNISHSKDSARHDHTCTYVVIENTRYSY